MRLILPEVRGSQPPGLRIARQRCWRCRAKSCACGEPADWARASKQSSAVARLPEKRVDGAGRRIDPRRVIRRSSRARRPAYRYRNWIGLEISIMARHTIGARLTCDGCGAVFIFRGRMVESVHDGALSFCTRRCLWVCFAKGAVTLRRADRANHVGQDAEGTSRGTVSASRRQSERNRPGWRRCNGSNSLGGDPDVIPDTTSPA